MKKQSEKLQVLLDNSTNLNPLYVLKEQLQALWSAPTYALMAQQLESLCPDRSWKCQHRDAPKGIYLFATAACGWNVKNTFRHMILKQINV